MFDGTGAPPRLADVAVRGQQIALVGDGALVQAARVIDATNQVVCPGFIDIHTHSDGAILGYPTADSRVRQGVTTELAGNCGYSAAPLHHWQALDGRGDGADRRGGRKAVIERPAQPTGRREVQVVVRREGVVGLESFIVKRCIRHTGSPVHQSRP